MSNDQKRVSRPGSPLHETEPDSGAAPRSTAFTTSRREFLTAAVAAAVLPACSSPSMPIDGGDGAAPLDTPERDGGTPPPPPRGKYLFQQALLFQRAHARVVPHTYTNSRGEMVTVAANASVFDGSQGGGAHQFGSSARFLCVGSRRPWANVGGDWIDASGTKQGTTPFARSAVIARDAGPGSVEIDVTTAIQGMFDRRGWLAFFLKTPAGGTSFAGALGTSMEQATLRLTYSDAPTDETLEAWYVASLRGSTAQTNAQDETVAFDPSNPAVLEFYRAASPTERVTESERRPTQAILRLPHTGASFGDVTIEVYAVDPLVPESLDPVAGLSAAYPLDSGILDHPSVCCALTVRDGDTMADALDEERSGTASEPWVPTSDPYGLRSEATMDPYLWTETPGVGEFAAVPAPTEAERDLLFPRRVHTPRGSKLVGQVSRARPGQSDDAIRLVHSDDALALGRGFTPLADGLGALEFLYAGGLVKNGQSTFQSVTGGQTTDLDLWFREQHIGRVIDGYMRMYVLLGEGWDASDDGLAWQYYAPTLEPTSLGRYPEELGVDPNAATWRRLDRTGKFPGGIQQVTSGHTKYLGYADPLRVSSDMRSVGTAGGGYSSSAGIHGYQGRWMFAQGYYKPGTPGPVVGGAALGIELYDFNGGAGLTIPSQNPVGGWDASWESFGTRNGGLSYLYPRRWYCVEMRWRMNSVRPYELPPVGTHWLEGGHEVDGFVEWWVDGIPASRSPLFAHRSSAAVVDWALQNAEGVPYDTVRSSPGYLRGISNVPPELFMGASSAVFNAYYGGRTYNESNKFVYLNGIVCSNAEYIGPMAGVSRENGGLG